MKIDEVFTFLKPSLEKFTEIEKKELCKLITGSSLTTPEPTIIELPPELPELQLNALEALFEELVKRAYNPGKQSYDFKEANKVIKEHFMMKIDES